MNRATHINDDNPLLARLTGRIASAMSEQTTSLPYDVNERLRFAREKAMAGARQARQALQSAPAGWLVAVSPRGEFALRSAAPWWQRALSVVPLVVLVSGLMAIDQWSVRERVLATADVDSVLLADDLPPAAYMDPGFAEFIRSTPPP